MKYRNKANKNIIVDAYQMTKENRTDPKQWPEWLQAAWQLGGGTPNSFISYGNGALALNTESGLRDVFWNDYIINGEEFDIMSAAFFNERFEPNP